MEVTYRKRPTFSTMICVVTSLLVAQKLYGLLPGNHPMLRPELIDGQLLAVSFSRIIALADLTLEIGGIIALWFMRPVAATFYAAQIVTTAINLAIGIFFMHWIQMHRAFIATRTMPRMAVWALPYMGALLIVGIQVSLFLYVWRVTTLLPRLGADQSAFDAANTPA